MKINQINKNHKAHGYWGHPNYKRFYKDGNLIGYEEYHEYYGNTHKEYHII